MISSISGASGAPLLQPVRSVQPGAIAPPQTAVRSAPATVGASGFGDGTPPASSTPRGSLLNLTV